MFLPGFGPRPFKKTRVTDLERFADRSLISMREKNELLAWRGCRILFKLLRKYRNF